MHFRDESTVGHARPAAWVLLGYLPGDERGGAWKIDICISHTARPQNLQMAFASLSHLMHVIDLSGVSA
jgi:hypothetical protein